MSLSNQKVITFAAGCFWGVQHYYSKVRGVVKATSGYTSGFKNFPTYEEVCKQETGHAEAVKVEYDTQYTNLVKLLDHFFHIADPTTLNQQKNDIGEQYRTGIYYTSEEDLKIIKEYIALITPYYKDPIVTEVLPMTEFWNAEDYHQEYLVKNPFGYCHLTPRHYKNIPLIDQYENIENKEVIIEDNKEDLIIDFNDNINYNYDGNHENVNLIDNVVEDKLIIENNNVKNDIDIKGKIESVDENDNKDNQNNKAADLNEPIVQNNNENKNDQKSEIDLNLTNDNKI